eukprot:SAG11_NODE_2846_length_2911_cov_2.406117_3_plen_56_part_00
MFICGIVQLRAVNAAIFYCRIVPMGAQQWVGALCFRKCHAGHAEPVLRSWIVLAS